MLGALAILIVAAALEVGGDAAIRHGLTRPSIGGVVAGSVALVAYGLAVNLDRRIDFGRLLGTYIAVFFVVSQLVGVVVFGERPSPTLVAGGVLIVLGGLVIQAGAR